MIKRAGILFLGLCFTLAMQIAKADSTWVYTVQIL